MESTAAVAVTVLVVASSLLIASLNLAVRLVAPKPRPALESEKFFNTTTGRKRFPSLINDMDSQSSDIHLSVIIPAFNEQDRLPIMLLETYEYLLARKYTWEIILVDDGSIDNTTLVARTFAQCRNIADENFRILKLEQNRGKGGSVTQGMLVARGSLLLFVDADGATLFSDLDKLNEQLEISMQLTNNGHGIAIGSRAHMVNSDAVRSALRNFLMHSLHAILYILGIQSIKDTQCGFKLLSKKSAQLIFPNMHVEGWIFDIEMLLIALQAGIPICEVAVTWHEVGGSKVQLVRDSIRMLRDLVVLRACYLLGVWKYPSIDKDKVD